jgi:hypothetical protein
MVFFQKTPGFMAGPKGLVGPSWAACWAASVRGGKRGDGLLAQEREERDFSLFLKVYFLFCFQTLLHFEICLKY